jgi:hypothetical protein
VQLKPRSAILGKANITAMNRPAIVVPLYLWQELSMHRRVARYSAPSFWLAGIILAWSVGVSAADKSAAEILPASIVGYLEIRQPGRVLETVVNHPLAKEIAASPEYQRALARPDYQQFQGALKLVEDRLGMKWPAAAGALTSGGLHMGFDLPSRGVVVLSLAADEKLAERARDTVLEVARSAASADGKPDPVKQDEHRGVKVYQLGDSYLAAIGKWLVAANKQPLVWMVLENYLASGDTLAGDQQYQTVLKQRAGDPAAWLYIDLRVLRLTGALRNALNKKSNNPPVELLAGGILGALPDAAYVTASLAVEGSRLSVTATLPCDARAVAKTREFYLGSEASGTAPPLLRPERTLLAVSTYRDFASLWRHAPDLFDDGINARFAEAESNLTTFFAGRNFRDDILGNLEPGMQLVVSRQEFPQAGVTPAIKLPAAAIVVRMKKPEETVRLFKMTFQSAIGFLNVAGAMNGVPSLDLNSEKVGQALVVYGEYLPPIQPETRTEAPLHFNASPAVAFVGDRFILSSSRSLALQLLEHVQQGGDPAKGVNTALVVDGKTAQAALADNRGPLIAQNMLQKGHDRAAAEREIDSLLAALRHIKQTSLRLSVEDSRLVLALQVTLAGAE